MRYLGSKCKRCRAVGSPVCGRLKCALNRKANPPGQHGATRKKRTEYAQQLVEKQKIRWTYDISERQLYKIFERASKTKGVTGTVLLQILESRLDNILFKSGFVASRSQARQLVSHGHILLNNKKASTPSIQLKPGDTVSVCEKSRPNVKTMRLNESAVVPDWLKADPDNFSVSFVIMPERDQIDQSFQENSLIEYYSR